MRLRWDLSFLAAATAVAIASISTIPAVIAYAKRDRNARPSGGKYEDRDGKATPESIAAFSTKWQKLHVLLWAAAGLGCQIAFAVLVNSSPARAYPEGFVLQNWLITASWGLLGAQAIAIAASRDSVHAYYQGMRLSASGLVVGSALLVQLNAVSTWQAVGKVALLLCTASAISAASLVIASILLPRRPDVFSDGRIVDRMFTVSAYSRLTFGWASTLMRLATEKGDLELTDMPELSHKMRPAHQSVEWEESKKDTVFKTLLGLYGWAVVRQWVTVTLNTSVSYLPWWIVLRLLETLENRQQGGDVGSRLWLYLVWLGIAKVAGALLESWLFWTMITDLFVPIRSQLAVIIFEKAMRRKSVKSASKSHTEVKNQAEQDAPAEQGAEVARQGTAAEPSKPAPGESGSEGEDASDSTTGQKSRQAVINLIGIDAKRVADFSLFQYMILGSVLQLIISLSFLVYLLGWLPIALGLFSVILITPLNSFFSKLIFAADKKLMKLRDEKLELVNEALNGIRQVKFSALEPQWEKRILGLRQKELDTLWEYFKSNIVLDGCWTAAPILLTLTSLGSYAWLHGNLTASVAFVSIGILNTLDFAVSAMPGVIRYGIDAWVSVKRIETYLNGPELKSIRTTSDRPEIAFQDASLAWPVDGEDQTDEADRFVLRDVTLNFPPGELSVISGKTGSGKSLMLAAVLGEVDLLSGSVHVPAPLSSAERRDHEANRGNWILPSSIAYIGQLPWIENATLRDNVLFGLPFDEERYEQTIAACALKKDLETLANGDKTEIGVNGVNLSGGQKWRVTVARAVYSRAGILVMDDIFSAVDAHVSRHILEKCLNGSLCKDRTRIIVTHHVALVEKHARFVVELADGIVHYAGLAEALQEEGILEKIKNAEQVVLEDSVLGNETSGETDGEPLKKQSSKVPKKFVEDETRETGSVKARVYAIYLKDSGGWLYWLLLIGLFILFQAAHLAQTWVVKLWTSEAEASGLPTIFARTRQYALHHSSQQTFVLSGYHYLLEPELGGYEGRGVKFWLSVYAGTCFAGVVIGVLRYVFTFGASYRASKVLFEKILFAVLRAPLRWTDTVPVGRILNRFTADFNSVDSDITQMGSWFLSVWLQAIGICVASIFVSPLMTPAAAVCLGWCVLLGKWYLAAARPAKRLDSTSKSPVFDFFGSVLTGLTTIRAFDKATTYIQTMYRKIEDNNKCSMNLYLFNRWIGWNMSVAGILFTVVVTLFVLIQPGMDAALAGFVLSFTMQFSHTVLMTVRAYAMLELEMNAVERVIEYSEIETENFSGEKPPAAWPTQGQLEVHDLVVAYASHLPPVLKGVTFQTNPAERVGVVGRTGAGKSSLTLALFRFLEPRSGSIYVDGLDIAKVPLSDLRSRLAIIPQDPVLFSGTVRSNLDPFDDHTDAELHDSLRRVHLVPDSDFDSGSTATADNDTSHSSNQGDSATDTATVTGPRNVNVFRDLSSPISEGGLNLSQGQRQLLCLARAIVSRPKIMVLDEATSAVDMATDTLIQKSIRDEFRESTLLVIAHRLSTIADFDRILVLSDGEVVELGTPKELWERGEGGVFRSMCQESGEKEKLKAIILGEEASGSA